ncbi:DUF2306 domain-containing protein [Seonamhaeicola maritimus]|uniref:DUF2306 domain-containing protein n=1 Tax=Seonamhaeicola maritimus TaxID=2591822 RepID=UPI002494C335|nr:DUF2306 domain-containing protein [Seonamhaeicola maritimus]
MKATLKNKKSIFWFGILLLLFLIALNFITDELKYFGFDETDFGRYWDVKWWLIGHLAGGIAALILGPFQFWSEFRNKYLKLHRLFGKIYLIAILIASLSSVYMAWTHAIKIHWTWAVALQALGFAWLCTAFMAYRAIRKRKIQQHKEWMIRSYVVTFAFVAFRWLVDLPFVIELGNFVERAPTVGWVSWVIPLFITEIILQWNKK